MQISSIIVLQTRTNYCNAKIYQLYIEMQKLINYIVMQKIINYVVMQIIK